LLVADTQEHSLVVILGHDHLCAVLNVSLSPRGGSGCSPAPDSGKLAAPCAFGRPIPLLPAVQVRALLPVSSFGGRNLRTARETEGGEVVGACCMMRS
jgi:hypothetical protein